VTSGVSTTVTLDHRDATQDSGLPPDDRRLGCW